MPTATANDITLHYEDRGDPADPVILLIMGLGAQMTLWPDEFVETLAGKGFRVVRYDNRDIGLSQKMDGAKIPDIRWVGLQAKLGLRARLPYQLTDMADDAVGLMDALGIDKAHIMGASMGGMIAQHVAMRYPERALSLISVMSTTGNSALKPADKDAMDVLIKRPESLDRESVVAHGVKIARTLGSPGYPLPEETMRANVERDFDRSFYPAGMPRQLAAIVADGDRRMRLRDIALPTLVLHGEGDVLIPVEHGQDTAAQIPGSKLITIPGMGHNFPPELWDEVAGIVADFAAEAADGR